MIRKSGDGYMRIDRFLVRSNQASRKEAKGLIRAKRVTVNGEIVKNANIKVDYQKDTICLDGNKIDYKEYVYIMLNKPQGVISATKDPSHRTVIDLVSEFAHYDIHPIGRLDIDTEGLLILTNDGKLTHNIISPKKHIPKTYYARLARDITDDAIIKFKEGITLGDGYKCMEAFLTILNPREIELTIFEGKFHQVKRMFKAIDNEVVFLKRLKMNNLELDSTLGLGEYKELSEDELKLLSE